MPLNTTNFRDVTDDMVQADDVLLSVRPSTRAEREDWDTQFQRAPDDGTGSPSTDDWRTVKTVPAGQRVVRDEAVQSTTSPFFWRARHVRPGSTAGPYTGAKGGQPREGADSAIHAGLNVAQLDVITNDIGKLTAGTLANTTGTRFINLSATGSNDFIHVEDASGTTTLSIQADGDADFGGTVSSSQFTATHITQGETTGAAVELRTDPIVAPGSTQQVASVQLYSSGQFSGRIIGRGDALHMVSGAGTTGTELNLESTGLTVDGPFTRVEGTNAATVAGVVVSGSPPSGDYPEGTFWVQTT